MSRCRAAVRFTRLAPRWRATAAPLAAAVAVAAATALAATAARAAPPPHAHGAPPAPAASRVAAARPEAVAAAVDRHLAADVAAGARVPALAVLGAQADLGGAAAMPSKTARTRFVRDRLLAVAEATQGPLRDVLRRRGVAFTPYHIVNAVAFEADAATLAAVAAAGGVAAVVPLPSFAAAPAPGAATGSDDVARAVGAVDASGAVAPSGAVDPSGAAELAVAERNIRAIGADKAWRRGFEGAGATVAIIDSGVNARHPALADRYRGRTAGDDHHWLDAIAGQPSPIDVNEHGTHVAGIAVGRHGSREIGVAPEAEWIACRIFAQDRGTTKAILDCLQWALAPTKRDGSDPRPDLAPDVVNASWGLFGRAFCDNPFPAETAIRSLVAAGIVFVAAAGNDGPRCGSICPPASIAEVLTVGNYDDVRRTIADSSSRGPFTFGGAPRIKPDVAAPGQAINSSVGSNGYQLLDGTSMAAPHVSGAAALLIGAAPALRGRPEALRAVLESTATRLNADQCGPSGARDFNNSAGHGVIDVDAAVFAALALPTSTATPPPTATPSPLPPTATRPATATAPPATATAGASATPWRTGTPGAATPTAPPTGEATPTRRPTGAATDGPPRVVIHLPYAVR